MFAKTQGKELVVEVKNDIGLLLEISKLLAEKGIALRAVNGAVCCGDCSLRLVTDDNLRAKEALEKIGCSVREENVILVELRHKSGMVKMVAETLASAGIELHYLYATVLEEQEKCLLVLHTSNDEHALPKLNSVVWHHDH